MKPIKFDEANKNLLKPQNMTLVGDRVFAVTIS